MQEKSIFLAKIQQVKQEELEKRWGLTEKEGVIAWNYEENSTGLGVFFETPVRFNNWTIFLLAHNDSRATNSNAYNHSKMNQPC